MLNQLVNSLKKIIAKFRFNVLGDINIDPILTDKEIDEELFQK